MQDNALAINDYLNPKIWEQMSKLATSLVQSGAFPKTIRNAPQALVVMQAGMEMGLKPMESINGIAIINGQISPWGKTTTKLLRNHGWRIQYEMLMERGGGCKATVTKGDEEYIDTLYFDQAEKSKWTKMKLQSGAIVLKAGWYEGANREMKLRYGVLSKIIKTYIPEVMSSGADIAEVAEDYIIVEETPKDEPKADKPKQDVILETKPADKNKNLADFLKKEKKNGKNKPKPSKKEVKTTKKATKPTDQAKPEEGEIIVEKVTVEEMSK